MKIFIEEQKFNQPLVFIGLFFVFTIVSITTFQNWEVISNGNIGAKIGSISGIIIVLLVALLFIFLKLKTRIDEIGIHYQFYPFHLNSKTITWNLISKCYIRNYNAISEYGGWGIKFSYFKKKEKSFTTKGNIGLQLELKNGKKILLGTQLKDSLQKTLDNYQQKITLK
ncbi:hypothetical protein [Lutibacter maritimus]|uniref:Uncharacterized protein n=1 Tax=Lutibacter maritimus TaxID=593133 RepID=A0A1I6STY9_9FLAO|nr:hypothetical protein [Lutibacter maritimus]SFS80392.1 hypothetical protein SAMN04488006_0122 [Lutibacter maritimus]